MNRPRTLRAVEVNAAIALLLGAVGVLAMLPALRADFVFDAESAVAEARYPIEPWEQAWSSGRPLTDWTFAVNRTLLGPEPWGYAAVNLLFHGLATALAWAVLHATMRRLGRPRREAAVIAALATLLWAVHPLQAHVTAYVVQRSELLASLGILLSLWCNDLASRTFRRGVRWAWLGGVAVGLLLAVGAKQVGLVAPVLLLLQDRLLLARRWRDVWRAKWPVYAAGVALIGVGVVWLGVGRLLTVGAATVGFHFGVPWELYFANQPRVIVRYVFAAVWPVGLVVDDFAGAPSRSLTPLVTSAAAVVTLGVVAAWRARRRPGLALAVLGSAVVLAPTSSFVPLADLSMLHRFHLPLLAMAAIVTAGAAAAVRRARGAAPSASARRGLVAGALALGVVVVATLGAAGWRRAAAFDDAVAFYRAELAARPENQRARLNLAGALVRRGETDEATRWYRAAHRDDPGDVVIWPLLGEQLARQGDPRGPHLLEAAVKLTPDAAAAQQRWGEYLVATARIDEGLAALREAVRLEPRRPSRHAAMGLGLARAGRLDAAEAALRRAIELDPRPAVETRFNYGLVLREQGKVDAAIQTLRTARRDRPDDAEIAVALGGALELAGDAEAAARQYQQAVAIAQAQPEGTVSGAGGAGANAAATAHRRLAGMAAGERDFARAVEHFRAAHLLQPGHAPTRRDLARALMLRGRQLAAADAVDAAQLVAVAWEAAARMSEHPVATPSLAPLLQMASGDAAQARRWVDAAIEQAEAAGRPRLADRYRPWRRALLSISAQPSPAGSR